MESFGKLITERYPVLIHRGSLELCLIGIKKRIVKERNFTNRATDQAYIEKHKENARRLCIIRDELKGLLHQL